MGEVIRPRFGGGCSGARPAPGLAAAVPPPPRIVHQDRGWRIFRVPRLGRYLALPRRHHRGRLRSARGGRGGGRAPQEIAVLTDCAFDEDLARCAVSWLNGNGPKRALLGSFVVATRDRYLYWKDAVREVAAIGGLRLVRLVDGCIAAAKEPAPVILLNPFAPSSAARRTPDFDRLLLETRRAVLRWTDPRRQLGPLVDGVRLEDRSKPNASGSSPSVPQGELVGHQPLGRPGDFTIGSTPDCAPLPPMQPYS